VFVIFVAIMMNAAYFDHNSTATTGFYNQVQAEQAHSAYRSLASQSALSLMPSSTYPTNLRASQTGIQSDGFNYDGSKLYDSFNAQPFKSEALRDCGLTKDQNGFKPSGDHTISTVFLNSLSLHMQNLLIVTVSVYLQSLSNTLWRYIMIGVQYLLHLYSIQLVIPGNFNA